MNSSRKLCRMFGSVSLVLTALLPITNVAAQDSIVIGLAGPLSGRFEHSGKQMLQGAEFAVEGINAGGGLLGRKLMLNRHDDQCNPGQAVNVAAKLIAESVPFVVGHFCSGATLAAAGKYTEAGILQLTPASTAPKFTEDGAWNRFRISGRTDQQGRLAGSYLLRNYKNARIAILNDGTSYEKEMVEGARSLLKNSGVEIVFDKSFDPLERDRLPIVQEMMKRRPSIIYIAGGAQDAAQILKLAKNVVHDVTLMGSDVLSNPQFWQAVGPSAAGTLVTAPSDPREYKSAADVVKKFKAKSIEPDGYVLYGYAAVQTWAMAATAAGTVDPRKVADSLRSGKDWNSVIGAIGFDKNGERKAIDYGVLVWSSQNNAPSLECAKGCTLDNNGKCVCPSQ